MKNLKLLILSLIAVVFSFVALPSNAKTLITNDTQNFEKLISSGHVEYVYIGSVLYKITYDDDGRILLVEPVE